MKESFYFPHDYDAANDPKLSALVEEYGATGYGIYWYIIELLHQDDHHKLPQKQYIYLAIAKQMKANVEQIENIVKHCILVCELFVVDGDLFYSPRVLRNFEKRAEISEKRSIAGKAGAIAKQNLANASKGKERKGNKKKVNNTQFIPPSFEEFKKYCTEKGFSGIAQRAFDGYEAGEWHDAQGTKILRWKQKLINGWFTEKNKDGQQNLFNGQITTDYSPESPKYRPMPNYGRTNA